MEEAYYTDLCEALHDLADELDKARVPARPSQQSVKREVQRVSTKLRELAGIDTR
jgi:hypothetical protein